MEKEIEYDVSLDKKSRLTAASRLAITIVITIVVVAIFLLAVIIPVSFNNYENEVFKTLNRYYNFSTDIENYKKSSVVGLIVQKNDEAAICSELLDSTIEKTSTIVSYDTLWEILERSKNVELKESSSINIKFVSEDETTVFLFATKHENNDLFIVYTTTAAFGTSLLFSKIIYSFLIGIAVTVIACISFGIIIYKNSKDIQKVNDFLLNYTNDYSLPNSTSSEILKLAENFKNYRRSLLQKDIEKQQLFQNISHELKTPITTIKMYAEGIQDGIYKNNNIAESAGIIIDETNNLLAKVSKIMQINKISYLEATKKNSLNTEKINLSEVLFNILNTYNDRAPDVKFNCELEKIDFRGTEEVWNTVFENIFDNNIRHGATEINISLDNDFLSIENNGESLDPTISKTIYEPFKKGSKGNNGLGVSIIQRSLTLYDYNLKIQNSEKGVIYMISDMKTTV